MKCDDAQIEREFNLLCQLASQQGHEVVKTAVINRLLAEVLWLDRACGARITYDIMQNIADKVADTPDPRRLGR